MNSILPIAALIVVGCHQGNATRVRASTSRRSSDDRNLAAENAMLRRRMDELLLETAQAAEYVLFVAHDLRGPLVNLQGFSGELRRGCATLASDLDRVELDARAKQRVRTTLDESIGDPTRFMEASLVRLEQLVDAVPVLSQTRRQDQRPRPLRTQDLVGSVVTLLRRDIEMAAATVEVGLLPDGIADVVGPRRVFSNLTGNALNTGNPAAPDGSSSTGEVCFRVVDNGLGIPVSQRARVFDMFRRLHPGLAAGNGIGLAAVRPIVEQHGGRVWVDGADGAGPVFHVALPASPPPGQVRPDADRAAGPPDGRSSLPGRGAARAIFHA